MLASHDAEGPGTIVASGSSLTMGQLMTPHWPHSFVESSRIPLLTVCQDRELLRCKRVVMVEHIDRRLPDS